MVCHDKISLITLYKPYSLLIIRMGAPVMKLTPEQQQAVTTQVPKLIEETMKRHGVSKPPNAGEMDKITKDTMRKLNSPAMSVMRTTVESAYLDFLKKKSPPEFRRVSTELTGKKNWDYLGVANMQVDVGGQMTTVKNAIVECAKITNPRDRVERFVTIMKQVAEMYRLKENGKNDFGIAGGELVSDPSRMMRDREMNCFSSSITLGSMLMYAARVAGVGDNIHASIVNIPSHNMLGPWTDAGHAILMVNVKGGSGKGEYFFDSTNAIVPKHGEFLKSSGSTIIDTRTLSNKKYNRGDKFEVGPAIMEVARYQDVLLKKVSAGQMVNETEIKAISKMPDSFQVKFIHALSLEQRRQYFMKTNITGRSPETRFTLASVAVNALEKSDKPAERQAALKYARDGAKALEEVVFKNRVGRLPIVSAYDNVTSMIQTLNRSSSAQDQALISRGSMHSFLANAALASSRELETPQVEAGIAMLQNYYRFNKSMLDKADVKFKCVLSLGLTSMENHIHRNEISFQTKRALETTLASLGVKNVDAYVQTVRNELAARNPSAKLPDNLDSLILQHTIGIVAWKAGVEGKDFQKIKIEAPSPLTNAVIATLSRSPAELLEQDSQLYAVVIRARPPSQA
jgi:hypothetical protein